MAMVINSNIQSLNAQRHLNNSLSAQNTATERLSSGLRINSAADDAAGLAIANRMTSQVKGLDMAIRNANDGVSMIQTAEGALSETTNILQRMRELSIQSANGIYDEGNRGTLNAEVQQLKAEIDRISETTTFNGLNILDGSLGEVGLQVGEKANQTIDLNIQSMDTKTLGLGSTSVDVLGAESTISFFTGANSLENNDVLINGQSIIKVGESFNLAVAGTEQQDLIDNINKNISGVTATTLATNTAAKVGDGVITGDDKVTIDVESLDGTTTSFSVQNTESLQEIADKINDLSGGSVNASINDDGKLVVVGENVASIDISDTTVTNTGTATDPEIAAGSVASATGIETTVAVVAGDAAAAAFVGNDADRLAFAANLATTASTASIALTSDNGEPITVERGTTGTLADLANLGFRESNAAGTIEGSTNGAGAFKAGDLTINSVEIGKSESADLDDKIAAINLKTDDTGVTATAFSSLSIDMSGATAAIAAGEIGINGVDVDITTTTLAGAVSEINAFTKDTGVTATLLGERIVLEGDVSSINLTNSTDDVDAVFTNSTTSDSTQQLAGTSTPIAPVASAGGIKLTSENGSPISLTHAEGATVKSGLLDSNSEVSGKFGSSVDSLDITTAAGANKAIEILDNAIQTISDVRGDLGAVTNRLDHTVKNLANVSENASAAKSRIMDSDFAAESANLSRAQVLQQAGNAMLAQANSRPQQVLSLLQ